MPFDCSIFANNPQLFDPTFQTILRGYFRPETEKTTTTTTIIEYIERESYLEQGKASLKEFTDLKFKT